MGFEKERGDPVKKTTIFLVLMFIFIYFLPANWQIDAASSDVSKIRTVIHGPKEVLVGERYTYTIEIEGIPDADKWSYEITMSDGSAEPLNGTSENENVFLVNITAPSVEGDFTITVNGTADVGNTTYWHKIEYKVTAVEPYIIKAKLYNSGSVDAKNVSVSLYVDGKFQYRITVDVPSHQNNTVELKFNPKDFSDGLHRARIVIDDSNGLLFLDNGKTEMDIKIYIGEVQEDHTSTWIALAILFGAGATYSLISYKNKRKRLKRRKW